MPKNFEKRLNDLVKTIFNSKFPDKSIETEIKEISNDFKIPITEVRKASEEKVKKLIGE